MAGISVGLLLGVTAAVFALWLTVNLFFVAVEGASDVVCLSSRRNWRARIDAVMLALPVLVGLGAAFLSH